MLESGVISETFAGLYKVGNHSLCKENAFRINLHFWSWVLLLSAMFSHFFIFWSRYEVLGLLLFTYLRLYRSFFFTFFQVNMKPFSCRKINQASKQEKSSDFDTLYIQETFVFFHINLRPFNGDRVFSFLFLKELKTPPMPNSPFEINWPLGSLNC